MPVLDRRAAHFVKCPVLLFPRLHVSAMLFPKIRTECFGSRIEQVSIFDGFVIEVVLGMHTENRSLNT